MKKVIIKVDCQVGICPVCGSTLAYDGTDHLVGFHYWTCTSCGATGKEGYPNGDMDDPLDGEHFDVCMRDGASVEILPPEKDPPVYDPKPPVTVDVIKFKDGTCPVCGGAAEQTGKDCTHNNGIDYEWKCLRCGATGWAEYSEEWITEFSDRHYDVKLKDGTPVNFNILGTDAPTVGRIDYLSSNGTVAASTEYVSEDAFRKEIMECSDTGVPVVIYLYRDEDGNTINQDFLSSLDALPAGFCIVDRPHAWKIPVSWEMCGYAYVPAPTLEEAMEKVRSDNDDIPLPDDASYVDGSFVLSYDNVEEIRSLHNDNRPDNRNR